MYFQAGVFRIEWCLQAIGANSILVKSKGLHTASCSGTEENDCCLQAERMLAFLQAGTV